MIAIILFIALVLWVLSDTITDVLSGGKPFAPNELKSFK